MDFIADIFNTFTSGLSGGIMNDLVTFVLLVIDIFFLLVCFSLLKKAFTTLFSFRSSSCDDK